MSIKTRLAFSLFILMIVLFQNTIQMIGYAKKPIAAPLLSKGLADFHYRKDPYQNKLGYGKNEYVVLYGSTQAILFDMNGKQLKKWDSQIKRALLKENCNILVIDDNQSSSVTEKNYNGEIVWQYDAPGITHHDIELAEDGNISFLYRKPLPKDFDLRNGCSHEQVITDGIHTINKNKEVVFDWVFSDHYKIALNNYKCTPEVMAKFARSGYCKELDWAHPNAINILKNNKWYRKGYQEFKPGNILVTINHFNEVIIIDKDSKKVVWSYLGDELPLLGPHEAKMIPEGLPGAGNILVYDNGVGSRRYSRILEINPITKKTIWSYSKPGEFFNPWAGNNERLKNGDTFIGDSESGRAFIVNKKGEIQWQFTDPENSWVKRVKIYHKDEVAKCLN
jgi:hypothetical protein